MAQERLAAQHLPQWLQTLLFPKTCDADISNCGFKVTEQLFRLLGIPDLFCEVFAAELKLLENLAQNRHDIIKNTLEQPQPIGKQVLLEVWMGKRDTSGINWSPAAKDLLDPLTNLGRITRWIAM